MTYKTAKTLKINTLTFKAIRTLQYEKSTMVRKEASVPFVTVDSDTTVGYSGLVGYVNSNKTEKEPREAPRLGFKKGPEPKFKKTKLVPVPFSKTALASIEEALSMGGFKDWADFKSLKGIGPVTSKIMEDLGWNETMFFFYKEDATGSGVTRVSNFFTLKQVKHKHPSGVNWRSPNPNKQISAEFCGGAMETVTWPGQKRKGKKVKLKPRVTDDGMKLILEFGHHLLMEENQIFEGKRMMGWKARNADTHPATWVKWSEKEKKFVASGFHHGSMSLLVPSGLTGELIREVVSMRTIKCRLADVQRDGSVIFHETGASWNIAPRSEQSHKVKLRKAIPGVTDVDFDIENMTTEQEQKYREALQAQIDEDLKKENAERAKEGKHAKLSAEDFQQLLEDTYIEYHSGLGLQMRNAIVERDEAHAKVKVYQAARNQGLELPYSKEEYAEATKTWHGACKKLGELKRLNPVNNMMYLYETYIQGQETEQYLEDKLNLSSCGHTYTSGDAKMSEAIERRLEGSSLQMVRPDGVLREDTSWDHACGDEVDANVRERFALSLGGRRDQKLSWKELMSRLDAVLLFAKFGRKEVDTVLRGSSRWISGEWTGDFKHVEVVAGIQASYEIARPEGGRACILLPGFEPGTSGLEEIAEMHRIPVFTRSHLETTPDRRWLIPAVPKPSTEEEYEARLEEGLMRLQF